MKISQFANNRSIFKKNIASVKNTVETVGQFGDVSGLWLNVKKTKAIWLGPWRITSKKPLELNWTTEPERALGIYISYNQNENYQKHRHAKRARVIFSIDLVAWGKTGC